MKIRLHNPRRRRSHGRPHGAKRTRSRSAGLMHAFRSGMKEARQLLRARNRAAGGGVLTIMKNKKRRKHRSRNRGYRRRRRNPVGLAANPRHRVRYSRSRPRFHRRRRNPSFGQIRDVGVAAGYAIVGGVLTRSLTQMILGEQNKGAFGYLANAGAALGLSYVAGQFASPSAAQSVLLGGAVMTAGRIIEDMFGKKLVEFAPGLGEDTAYDLSGVFTDEHYPVPVSSLGPTSRVLPPIAPEVIVAAAKSMAGPWRRPWTN